MITKILFSTLTFLAVETCKEKATSEKSATSATTETPAHTSVNADAEKTADTPKTPEMSTGMPPDKEAVQQAEKETAEAAAENSTITLKEGQSEFLKTAEMNVKFVRMVEDSRCPKDVQCIWAGNATAELEIMGTYTRPVLIQVSTTDDAAKNHLKVQQFNGYDISLTSVSPETTSDKGFKALQGKYQVGVRVSKNTTAQVHQVPATRK